MPHSTGAKFFGLRIPFSDFFASVVDCGFSSVSCRFSQLRLRAVHPAIRKTTRTGGLTLEIPDLDDKILVQNREPSSSNFQILGIELEEDVFSKAAAKLGKARIVDRGNASTGRSQVCYVSPEEQGRIHLVFERGEVNEVFYLFEGGADWKGSNLCIKSNLIAKNLSVASGLRLGKTPAEIRGILGKPSVIAADKLSYFFSVEKKTPAADFENLKQRYPELSEEELHRNYEFYSFGAYIEARFTSGKLTYLAVSKTEAY